MKNSIDLNLQKETMRLIFFSIKKNLNLIGWQNIDIYQNLVITYLYNIQKNTVIEKKISSNYHLKIKLPFFSKSQS